MNLEERAAWALHYIKEKNKLNNVELGKILGVDKNTVQTYYSGKGSLKGAALAVIVKNFGINGEWLMTGRGEPFPGAREKFPEVCGDPPTPRAVYDRINHVVKTAQAREAQAQYPISEAQNLDIDVAIGKAYRVLAAGTALSDALYLNIQQFAAALDADIELKKCKEQLIELRDDFNDLKRKVERQEAVPAVQKEAV